MREIMVRVKGNSGDKLWFSWNIANIHKPGGAILHEAFDWCTMGLYTGLKDKNGVEIYEGDIIKQPEPWSTRDSEVGIVYWDNDRASFGVSSCRTEYTNRIYSDCEVIGNIYDNPELSDRSE